MNLFTNEGNLSIYPSFINYWSREVITYNNDVRWRGEGGGEGGRRRGSRRGEGGGEGREEGGGEGGEKEGRRMGGINEGKIKESRQAEKERDKS